MDKQFKILSLIINKDDAIGIEVLLAELSILEENDNEGISFEKLIFENKELFVFSLNSNLAKYLLEYPEETIKLDLLDFKKGKLFLSDDTLEANYHKEYLVLKNNSKSFKDSDYSYSMYDPKKLLAYFHYYRLTDYIFNDDSGDLNDIIQELKKEIEHKIKMNEKIDGYYYFLASSLMRIQEFEEAKRYYLKCANEETPRKADALFALACLKIFLEEDGEKELQNAIQIYEENKSDFLKYVKAIQNPPVEIPIKKLFTFSAKKINDKTQIEIDNEGFALIELHVAFNILNKFLNRELRCAHLLKKNNGFFVFDIAFVELDEVEEENDFLMDDFVQNCEISGFDLDEIQKIIKSANQDLESQFIID